jgi:hypothetical protein
VLPDLKQLIVAVKRAGVPLTVVSIMSGYRLIRERRRVPRVVISTIYITCSISSSCMTHSSSMTYMTWRHIMRCCDLRCGCMRFYAVITVHGGPRRLVPEPIFRIGFGNVGRLRERDLLLHVPGRDGVDYGVFAVQRYTVL